MLHVGSLHSQAALSSVAPLSLEFLVLDNVCEGIDGDGHR